MSDRSIRFTTVTAWLGLLGNDPAAYIAEKPEAAAELLADMKELKTRFPQDSGFNHVMDQAEEAVREGRWDDVAEALRRSYRFA